MIHEVKNIIDDQPCFEIPLDEILATLRMGGALEVLSPVKYHTARQRRWYKGVAIVKLHLWNGDTMLEWDKRLKDECGGAELLKREKWLDEDGVEKMRFTTVGVGKKNFTQFIQNILSTSIKKKWPCPAPNPDLRTM